MKKTVCVDFDGVLNEYKGYNERDLYSPKPFAEDFLNKLSQEYEVVIHTSRVNKRVEKWLERNGLDKYISKVTSKKVPAIAYIDDRAIQFKGNYNETLDELESFEPYWHTSYKKPNNPPRKSFDNILDELFEDGNKSPKDALLKIGHMKRELHELEKIIIYESFSRGKMEFKEEVE